MLIVTSSHRETRSLHLIERFFSRQTLQLLCTGFEIRISLTLTSRIDSVILGLVEHDYMIETFASSAANESLDERILPRRAWGREHFFNPIAFAVVSSPSNA